MGASAGAGAVAGSASPPITLLSYPSRVRALLFLLLLHLLLFAGPAVHPRHRASLAGASPLPCAPVRNDTTWRWVRGEAPADDTAFGPLELEMSNCALAARAWRSPAVGCLAGKHLVLAGDSTMRQQFLNLIKALDGGSWEARAPFSENMLRVEEPLPLEVSGAMHAWYQWSATQPRHACDCARCEGNFIWEEPSKWEVDGLRVMCSLENRYYVHGPSGTRVTFLLLLGRHPMVWNDLSFLGVAPCHAAAAAVRARNASAACPQRGCAAGACFPPTRARPALEALEERLRELQPDELVISAGAWGSWDIHIKNGEFVTDEAWIAAAVAALRRGLGRGKGGRAPPRVWWRTPNFAAPGNAESQQTWGYWRARSPNIEAAFRAEGWGVIDAGGLLASAMVLDARAGRGGAWPFGEAHPAAQAAAEASLRGDPRLAELPAQKVAVMTDWMHPSAWWLRHLNTRSCSRTFALLAPR